MTQGDAGVLVVGGTFIYLACSTMWEHYLGWGCKQAT